MSESIDNPPENPVRDMCPHHRIHSVRDTSCLISTHLVPPNACSHSIPSVECMNVYQLKAKPLQHHPPVSEGRKKPNTEPFASHKPTAQPNQVDNQPFPCPSPDHYAPSLIQVKKERRKRNNPRRINVSVCSATRQHEQNK